MNDILDNVFTTKYTTEVKFMFEFHAVLTVLYKFI